jgi:hypothetical protein
MPKKIGDDLYYSVPEAAKSVGVSRMTMFRWVTKGVPLEGFRIKALRDPISHHYYVSEESVNMLATRFQPVEPLTAL